MLTYGQNHQLFFSSVPWWGSIVNMDGEAILAAGLYPNDLRIRTNWFSGINHHEDPDTV
jgi:hypothetical protein